MYPYIPENNFEHIQNKQLFAGPSSMEIKQKSEYVMNRKECN
jgi:hypothetical protein